MVGVVTSLVGSATVLSEDGVARALQVGDEVQQGEVVITASGASVEVQSSGDIPFVIPENTEFLLNDELFGNGVVSSEAEITDETVAGLLEALEAGTDLLDALEAPAAGAPGGAALMRGTAGLFGLEEGGYGLNRERPKSRTRRILTKSWRVTL